MSRLSVDSNFDGNEDSTPSWAEGAPTVPDLQEDEEDEAERTYSRRRSLECSAVQITIAGTESTQGHTLYIIQISSGIKQWEVARRFRDFCYLDKQLRKNFPKLKIPVLPPKQYLFSSTSSAVVDERRNQLETYLKSLMFMPSIWSRNDLALFLNDGANSMMFIWNFERMRKMQDMLSSMTVENEHETAKLTTDLTLAKTQVQALQGRLSRMEMLLLQQATGMASEELSPNAIRSLSGMGDRSLAQQLASEIDEDSSALYGEGLPRKGSVGNDSSYAAQSTDEDGLNPLDQAVIDDAITAHVASGRVMPPSEVVQVLSLAAQESPPVKSLKGKTPEQVRALAVSLQLQEALRISNDVLNEKFDINSPDSGRRGEANVPLPKVAAKAPAIFPLSAAEAALFAHNASDPAGSGWISTLTSEIEEIVQVLTPTEASIQARYKVFRYVRELVSNTLAVQLFPVGSFVSHTFLPDGDLDASAFICKNENDAWYVKVNEALCMSSFSHGASNHPGSKHSSFDTIPDPPDMLDSVPEEMSISNVGFVNGDVKKIKIMINNISVDISMNQIGSLYAQYLIETVDKTVGKEHLFKKSMLLVEAWCRYESPRHTQGGGSIVTGATGATRLSPWTITVMLIWVFNSEGARISCPVQALGQFLRIFACFDWSKYALTVKGLVNASDLSVDESLPSGERFFTEQMLDKFSQVEEEAVAAVAADESIMIGDVVVKIDTSLKVEESGTKFGGADAQEFTTPGTAVGQDVRPPLSKTNSAAITGMVTEKDAVYVQGLLNIIDPAGPSRNLAAGLDVEGYQVVTTALYEGYKHFQGVCESFAKLQTAYGQRLPEPEVAKSMKNFLINTQLKVIGWNANFKKKPGNLSLAFGSHQDFQQLQATNPDADLLQGQFDELEFSLRYAELVLNGRINQRALIQLIIRILMHKGPMPVGEVGKNLQAMTGSDTLSRRLKEQFSGLKKAMEHSGSARIKVGTEHPFNPVVLLVPENQIPGFTEEASGSASTEHVAPALAHHEFAFIPVLAAVALAAREKEALNAANVSSNSSVSSGKSSRSFRRQPPFYLDNASMSSRGGYINNVRRGTGRVKAASSPRNGNMNMNVNMNMYPSSGNTSPMHAQHYARAQPGMMMPQGGVMPGPFPGLVPVPVGMQLPMGSPLQGGSMPMYAQQQIQQLQLHYMQQQQQMYQTYQAQVHPSMANSLSSSYGAQSPMSMSPMAGYQQAYMNMGAAQQPPVHAQQQQHHHQQHHQHQQMQGQGQGQGQHISPEHSPKAAGQQPQYW